MTKPNQPERLQQPLPFFGRSQQETQQLSSARGNPLVEPTDPTRPPLPSFAKRRKDVTGQTRRARERPQTDLPRSRCQSTTSRLAEPPSNIASANYRILDHSSRGLIQDAATPLPRLTVAALIELLTLLRTLDEHLRSNAQDPRSPDTGGGPRGAPIARCHGGPNTHEPSPYNSPDVPSTPKAFGTDHPSPDSEEPPSPLEKR